MVIRIELTAADLTPEVLTALQTLIPAEKRGVANASAVKKDAPVPAVEAPSIPAVPTVPVAEPPAFTLDEISRAGAALVDAGKMEQLLALLAKFGVQAVTQLPSEQYGVFATELRALGAQI